MLRWMMLCLYILFIAYILWRGISCLKKTRSVLAKKQSIFGLAIVFVLFCALLMAEHVTPEGPLHLMIHKICNFWLAFFIYLLFFIVVTDLVLLLLKLINKKKEKAFLKSPVLYRTLFFGVILLSAAFTVYGFIHGQVLHLNKYEVTVEKEVKKMDSLNVVLIADLHLGYSIGCDDMEEMVENVNALEPDLIVLAGDIVDNNLDALDDKERLEEILSGMKSKYGCYAVYGNHDVKETLIGGFAITPAVEAFRDERLPEFLENCGFKMIEDDAVLIDDSFYVVGRLDGEKAGDGTNNRKSTEELLKDLDKSKPILLISHEPDELKENAEAGVDIQFSGHTHAGQFFPLTIVQPFVFKNYWGYLEVDQMHSLVTSGMGIYGPNIRVGTDREIMQIEVKFE